EGFDSLKVGDQVSATYFEATVVRVRKPGDPPASPDPQTTVTRKDRTEGAGIRREQTYTVRIESLDMTGRTVRVKRGQEPAMTLAVREPGLLQGLKTGDTVDVTYYESLFVKVTPAKRAPNPFYFVFVVCQVSRSSYSSARSPRSRRTPRADLSNNGAASASPSAAAARVV